MEGADLARRFAREGGFDERRAQLIWDSVALNSTPSIGLYKEAEVALCTAGVCLDVVGMQYDLVPSDEIARIVAAFPRLGMKQRMSRCFCRIAETNPETTYDNFARDFGERFVPGYKAPSAVDFVMNTPFPEWAFRAKPMQIDHLHSLTSPRLRVINADATVQAAALALTEPNIGLVVVCHDGGEAAGVLSKSDLVRHLALSGSAGATAATLMTRRVVSCRPDDDVHAVWQTMTAQALQNVPVLGANSRPLGILDIRDAMNVLLEQDEIEEQLLANYIAGIGYQ